MTSAVPGTPPKKEPAERSPGGWTVLGWALAASPVIAFMEASQLMLQKQLQGDRTTLFWEWTHVLAPWVAIAVCAAGVAPIVRRFPLPQKRPAKAIAAHVVAALLFPVARLGLLDAVHVVMQGSRYVEHLVWLLAGLFVSDVMLFWAIAGTLHAIRHVRVQAALREDALRLEVALADARFSALSQQLRPHFLFNALNSATMLVRAGESDQAIELLARLSGLIRELLREHPHEIVPLEQELAFLREYLALEGVRFGDRLGVTVECDGRLGDSPVPFLILQPIVENALRYGVAARAGQSQLHVGAMRTADGVLVRIEERGNGGHSGAAEAGHGVGLANTHERLRARYGDAASFTLRVDPGGNGSVAELVLPAAV
ncbi:MAG TPA: histidine kinase [Gemmatimonadaceae bacterium]|nr:histidine kinase [Gemmatimonadaceae bacterium]